MLKVPSDVRMHVFRTEGPHGRPAGRGAQ